MTELFKTDVIPQKTMSEVIPNPNDNAGPVIKQRIIGSEMQIGGGAQAFYADQKGIWLGAVKFEDAPFSVRMDGEAVIGNITLTAGHYIRSGQTDYDTGIGFWMGENTLGGITTPRFSIGNSDGDKLLWDGSGTLKITGAITGSIITGGIVQTASGNADKVLLDIDGLHLQTYDPILYVLYDRVLIAGEGIIFFAGGVSAGAGAGAIFGGAPNQLGISNGNNIINFDADGFWPDTDIEVDLGKSGHRWTGIWARDNHIGDAMFHDKKTGNLLYRIDEDEESLNFYNKNDELIMQLSSEGNLKLKGKIID